MNINLHFIIFITTIIVGIESLLLLFHYRTIKNINNKSFFWWTLGSFLNFFALIFNFFRGRTFPFNIFIPLNNLFFLGALICLHIGIVKFFIEYSVKKWHISLLILITIISSYFTFINYSYHIRVINFSFFVAISTFLSAKFLYKIPLKDYPTKILFYIFSFYSLFFFLRGLEVIKNKNIELFKPTALEILTYIILIFFTIFFTFVYILMINNKLQLKILEDNKNLQTIFDTSPDGIIISKRANGKIIMVNRYLLETLGYTKEEILGNSAFNLNLWNKLEERQTYIDILKNNGKIENLEISFNKKNKEKLIALISANIIILEGEECVITVARNITNKKAVEEILIEKEKFLWDIIENNGALIYAKDLKGNYILINKKWEEITGLEANKSLGKNDLELFPEDIAKEFLKVDSEVINKGKIIEKEEILENIQGKKYFISIKFPTRDSNNNITGICGISTDITERKNTEEQINELVAQLQIERNYAQATSITDALTGIYNRRYFDDTLRKEFFHLKRAGTPLSIIMFDIDFFKKFNDTYGHLEGDECLKKIALKIKEIVKRETDTFARYGGEEFVVILPNTNNNGAVKLAETIRKEVLNLKIPHNNSDINDYVTISLGIATVLKNNISSPEQIISLADGALYRAKEEGRNCVKIATISLIDNHQNTSFLQLFWNKSNECGNPVIDEEHKHLMDISNKIIYAFTNNFDKDHCIKLIEELMYDISTHFHDEEIIFDKTLYPYKEHHKLLHKKLIDKAQNFLDNYKNDKSNFGDLISFIIYDVVSQHLEIEDKTYFPYINE